MYGFFKSEIFATCSICKSGNSEIMYFIQTFGIISVVTCNRPIISDAAIIQPNQQTYSYNDTVTFSCSSGFKLIGESEKRCQHTGYFGILPSCTGHH